MRVGVGPTPPEPCSARAAPSRHSTVRKNTLMRPSTEAPPFRAHLGVQATRWRPDGTVVGRNGITCRPCAGGDHHAPQGRGPSGWPAAAESGKSVARPRERDVFCACSGAPTQHACQRLPVGIGAGRPGRVWAVHSSLAAGNDALLQPDVAGGLQQHSPELPRIQGHRHPGDARWSCCVPDVIKARLSGPEGHARRRTTYWSVH